MCVFRASKKVVVVALESSAGSGWTFNYVFLYKSEVNELHSSLRRACNTCLIRVPQLKYLGCFLRFSFRQYLEAATFVADLISSERDFQALK